jgi:ubiquinone/menaquinone biosynthesis C-methylase UbiE
MARRYDPDLYHTASPLPIRLLERRRVSVLVQLVAAQAHERVLEVGCGAGNVLERFPESSRTGIDISFFLLAKARARLGRACSLTLMNAESLAFPDAVFDKVVCTEVIEHVLHPRQVLAEIRRVLAPGGHAVVSVPNEPLIDRLKRAFLALPLAGRLLSKGSEYQVPRQMTDEWHLHELDDQRLREYCEGLFRVVEIRVIPWAALPLRYVVKLVSTAEETP